MTAPNGSVLPAASGASVIARHPRVLVAGIAALAVVLVFATVGMQAPGVMSDGPEHLAVLAQETTDDADGGPDEPAEPGDAEEAVEAVTVTYEVYLARDPFEPVVPEEVSEPEPTDPEPEDPADPDPTDPDPRAPGDPSDPHSPDPDPSDPDPTDPTEPSDPDGCVGNDEVVCDGHVVSVVEITEVDGDLVAVIQVDDVVYEVRVGQQFAERFRLLDLDREAATIQFGDDVFRSRPGATVLK